MGNGDAEIEHVVLKMIWRFEVDEEACREQIC